MRAREGHGGQRDSVHNGQLGGWYDMKTTQNLGEERRNLEREEPSACREAAGSCYQNVLRRLLCVWGGALRRVILAAGRTDCVGNTGKGGLRMRGQWSDSRSRAGARPWSRWNVRASWTALSGACLWGLPTQLSSRVLRQADRHCCLDGP